MTAVDPASRGTVVRVRLYVAGDAPNSVAAVTNLRGALARCAANAAEVETIDVLRDPLRALDDGVLVTPMLVKIEPLPQRRILGNLHDQRRCWVRWGSTRPSMTGDLDALRTSPKSSRRSDRR